MVFSKDKNKRRKVVDFFKKTGLSSPFSILGLNLFLYLLIFFIRKSFGSYGTIETKLFFSLYGAAFIISLVLLYFWAWRNINKLSLKLIIGGYLLFSLILLFTPPLTSLDLYGYVIEGRIFTFYSKNPYLHAPKDFPEDPFLEFRPDPFWQSLKAHYGPLWTLFSSFLVRLGKNNTDLTFFLFKFWGFLGNSLMLILISKISKISNPKRNPKKALLLYAWNPFILTHFIGNGGNDIWMMFFGLSAFYFYFARKDYLIIPSLALAGLVKFGFWILIPLFFIFLLRENRINIKILIFSTLLTLAFLIVFSMPFLKNIESLQGITQQIKGYSIWQWYSLPMFLALMLLGLRITFSFPILLSLGLWLGRLSFVILYIYLIFQRKDLISTAISILIFFVFLGSAVTMPWYLAWSFPLFSLMENWRRLTFWTLIALGSFFFLYSVSISLIIIGLLSLLLRKFKEIKPFPKNLEKG